MRRPKTAVISIACGIVCAAAVLAFMGGVEGEARAAQEEALARYGGDQIEVCVASRDIASGEELSPSNVEMRLWVASLLPEGAVTSIDELEGERAGSAVYAGEVVTSRRFASDDAALEAPEGLSVLSVPVRDVQAVGGAVVAGMEVDLYATGASGTSLLAERAPVVSSSAAGEDGDSSGSISWVALAVGPESVQEIITASQTMELYLVLPGKENRSAS